jgi:hypothetical protein
MKYVVHRLAPWQNAKVMALLSAVVFFVVLLPFVLVGVLLAMSDLPGSSIFELFLSLILMPLIYSVIALVAVFVGCFVYNWMVSWTGGLQLELQPWTESVLSAEQESQAQDSSVASASDTLPMSPIHPLA